MALEQNPDKFVQLQAILLPVLAEASVGVFDRDIPLDPAKERDFNELLAGVQGLLEVIRQQQLEIAAAKNEAQDARRRATEILDDVLKRTII
jgi:hypothetical protein